MNNLLKGWFVLKVHSAGGGPIRDRAMAAQLDAARDLVATGLGRRGCPRQEFLDGAILKCIVEEPILSEQLNTVKLLPRYSP